MANIHRLDDLQFQVIEWADDGSGIIEVLAAASVFSLAEVAYDKALEVRPRSYITLQQGIRVVRERKGQGGRTPNKSIEPSRDGRA